MKLISKILKLIFSRLFIACTFIAIQLTIIILLIWQLSSYFVYISAFFIILSMAIVLFLMSNEDNPSVKLSWVIMIMLLPIFGGLFYLILGKSRFPKKYRNNMINSQTRTARYYPKNRSSYDSLKQDSVTAYRHTTYLKNTTNMPVYEHTECDYLAMGEIKFERLKKELLTAEHYIFIEYFIIHEGEMWNSILEILIDKAQHGVEVRVMYDDFGCMQTLPYGYNKKLESYGIKCVIFNPFKPSLTSTLQNRDHRKIVVIDGHTAMTGGINLADEYINTVVRFGHWKDCAVILHGEAAYSFTLMFLEMWNFYSTEKEIFDMRQPKLFHKEKFTTDGFVMPYGDTPLDNEYVSESIYLNIINNAKDFLFINSPYLIVDNEMLTALKLASKRGVDVKIVTPHIADKWYVHLLTRSYYPQLISAGIQIYEYTPGFIHSKTFVCDDSYATIGTVNMDYRSLYHHFECGVWLYKNKAVMELKDDFNKTLEKCQLISYDESMKVTLFNRIMRGVLRLVAPLL